MDLRPISSFASRNHGLVTFAACAEMGWSRRRWSTALGSGLLHRVHPGVARLAAMPDTDESRILAALLRAGSAAVASHRSAAYVWGVQIAGAAPVDVTIAGRNRMPRLAGVCLHRPTDLGDLRPVVWRGIPVTNPLRVLIDLGAVSPERVADAMAHFLIGGTVSLSAAQATLDRHRRRGRPGVAALESAIGEWVLNDRPPDSVLEVEMAKLLARFGLPAAKFHEVIHGIEVDFRIKGTRLIVECDGWRWHGVDRAGFERDRQRDAELGRHGYIVRRFSWLQITREPRWVAGVIRDHLLWAM